MHTFYGEKNGWETAIEMWMEDLNVHYLSKILYTYFMYLF